MIKVKEFRRRFWKMFIFPSHRKGHVLIFRATFENSAKRLQRHGKFSPHQKLSMDKSFRKLQIIIFQSNQGPFKQQHAE